MAKKSPPKIVHCRYPKCRELHDTTELLKDEAVKGGSKNSYYHPDCWETLQTVNKIRDLFCKEVNPALTGQQIGQLVSIVNHMAFAKGISVKYILFSLQYFINHKPGVLKYPGGIAYIVQDKDVIAAWKKEKERQVRAKIKEQQKETVSVNDGFGLDLPEKSFEYKPQKMKSFADILG